MKKIFLILIGVFMLTCFANEKILPSDTKILMILIVENHDSFIDLTQQTTIAYGPSPEIPNNTDYTKMRKTVYEKLVQAQSQLPEGLKFRIYEAYRSLKLQKMLFDNRFTKVQILHPTWSKQQLFDETTKLIAPVVNFDGSTNMPPHSTGGAIDIYLIDTQGNPVPMGIHPKDWMNDTDGSISETNTTRISPDAQKYRKIMGQVLSSVGFINFPFEYWHWSYGDRYWAYHSEKNHAIYNTWTNN